MDIITAYAYSLCFGLFFAVVDATKDCKYPDFDIYELFSLIMNKIS